VNDRQFSKSLKYEVMCSERSLSNKMVLVQTATLNDEATLTEILSSGGSERSNWKLITELSNVRPPLK
jgi:hypothetical protein